ncbi:MAG: hypothetical protein E6K65_08110 [Nitrospirae bacterium]|nr:MAG: hypothetical protein E6K65_08110 [Nitrospirota bacterium]
MSKAQKKEGPVGARGAWIVRDVPRDLMRRARGAAALQGKSVKGILIELMENYLQELERKGLLPKVK